MVKKKEANKKITTMYLSSDIVEDSKNNTEIKSLSDYLEKSYRDRFMSLDKTTKQLDKSLKEVEFLKKKVKSLKSRSNKEIINKEQMTWIKRFAKGRIRRGTEQGVYAYFKNEYNLDITFRQFRILVHKYGGR